MSWTVKVEVEGKFHNNGLFFETEAEARQHAMDLFNRWFLITDYKTVEVDSQKYPVNSKFVDGQLIRVYNK